MRKIQFAIIVSASIAFFGCGKENPATPVYSSVMYLNAAVTPVTAPASSLYLNDSLFSNGIVLYNTTTGYFGLTPGTHVLKIKQEALPPNAPVTIAADASATFDANKAYTLVSYDSLHSSNSIRVMRLTDDLTIPAAMTAKVRFLQLSPVYPDPVDVTYVRMSAAPATPIDSFTISNITFPGASPVAANHEGFTTITAATGGQSYTIKVKLAGTQTVVTSIAPVMATGSSRKIVTHYLTGNAQGRALAFGQLTHY